MSSKKDQIYYNLMLIPGMVILFTFAVVPMFGIIMAFQNFVPARGIWRSKWVGLSHFEYMFQMPDATQVFSNTLIIAVLKIIFGFLAAVVFAILLNEIRGRFFKRTIQTFVYLPHFLSWVILAGILGNMLSFEGIINKAVTFTGSEPILFLASNFWFRPILIASDVWKGFGFSAIVYLAAITGIDPSMYDAASIDGANRWGRIIHVTLPGMMPTMVLMLTLSLGNVLNANFDQVLNLYNPIVYRTGDIIDTYVYRLGLLNYQYSFGTAVGLLKSFVSTILIVVSYKLADKYAGYRIF